MPTTAIKKLQLDITTILTEVRGRNKDVEVAAEEIKHLVEVSLSRSKSNSKSMRLAGGNE